MKYRRECPRILHREVICYDRPRVRCVQPNFRDHRVVDPRGSRSRGRDVRGSFRWICERDLSRHPRNDFVLRRTAFENVGS